MRRNGLYIAVGMVSIGVTGVTSVRADSRSTRETKGGGVNFHLASGSPVSGFQKVSTDSDSAVLYVGPRPIWTGREVVSARTTDTRDGAVMELTLTADAAERLVTQKKDQGGDRVAIYVDGKLMSSGALSTAALGSRATITGLTPVNTENVVRLLKGERPMPVPVPTVSALISIVPAGQSDGAYLFDVYVQGVANLRSYQIGLVTSNGMGSELVREKVEINKTRPDFVFTDLDVIAAADQVGGRLAGVLVDGGVNTETPGYLGTYVFRAPPGASGTFEVAFDTGDKTFLADSQNQMIEFRTGPAASISITGEPIRRVIGDK